MAAVGGGGPGAARSGVAELPELAGGGFGGGGPDGSGGGTKSCSTSLRACGVPAC